MYAVARALDHRSQEATDCRWIRVVWKMATGHLMFAATLVESAREIWEYPNYGDQQKVRPTIRAGEHAMHGPEGFHSEWSPAFWDHCMRQTRCLVSMAPSKIRTSRLALFRYLLPTFTREAHDHPPRQT